jgi:ABC-type phosphate transport system permease subunit
MALTLVLFLSILLCALLFGVFWGPWLALSRSMATFTPAVFIAITHRMDHNLGTLMSLLMPVALASIVTVLILSFSVSTLTFVLAACALALFVMTLLVTMLVEVPIVTKIRDWQVDALPPDWAAQRDRWVSFHLFRVVGGFAGLALLVSAALF